MTLNQSDEVIYLPLLYFCLSQHRVVPFVLICQTQVADALLVGAAVNLQQPVVSGTNSLLEFFGGRHQLVFLERSRLVVRLDMEVAVRGQTHQTGLDSFAFPPGADVALHIVGLRKALTYLRRRVILESGLFEFLHHVGQHGVPGEHRPRVEGLPTLRADEDPQVVVLVPVALDTVGAVAVSTGDGDRILQHVQTYRAVELVFVQNHAGLSHRPKRWRGDRRWAKTQESDRQLLLCLQEVTQGGVTGNGRRGFNF